MNSLTYLCISRSAPGQRSEIKVTGCRTAKEIWKWVKVAVDVARTKGPRPEARRAEGRGQGGSGVLGRGQRAPPHQLKLDPWFFTVLATAKRLSWTKSVKLAPMQVVSQQDGHTGFVLECRSQLLYTGPLAGPKVTQRSNKKCTYRCVVSTAHWHRWSQTQAPVSLCVCHYAEILIDMRQKV